MTSTPIRDSILPSSGLRFLTTSAAYWGGTVTASTGERVTIRVSDTYPQDPAFTQRINHLLAIGLAQRGQGTAPPGHSERIHSHRRLFVKA